MAAGLVHPKAADLVVFHRAFLASIAQHGRLFELGMLASYKLRSGALFEDLGLAPAMYMKGKLGLVPHSVHDTKAIARIFERAADAKVQRHAHEKEGDA